MKKQLFILVSLLVAASMILVGCGLLLPAAPAAACDRLTQVMAVYRHPGSVTAPRRGDCSHRQDRQLQLLAECADRSHGCPDRA